MLQDWKTKIQELNDLYPGGIKDLNPEMKTQILLGKKFPQLQSLELTRGGGNPSMKQLLHAVTIADQFIESLKHPLSLSPVDDASTSRSSSPAASSLADPSTSMDGSEHTADFSVADNTSPAVAGLKIEQYEEVTIEDLFGLTSQPATPHEAGPTMDAKKVPVNMHNPLLRTLGQQPDTSFQRGDPSFIDSRKTTPKWGTPQTSGGEAANASDERNEIREAAQTPLLPELKKYTQEERSKDPKKVLAELTVFENQLREAEADIQNNLEQI